MARVTVYSWQLPGMAIFVDCKTTNDAHHFDYEAGAYFPFA